MDDRHSLLPFDSFCSTTSDFQSDFSTSDLSSLSPILCNEEASAVKGTRDEPLLGREDNGVVADLQSELAELRLQVRALRRTAFETSLDLTLLKKSELWYRERLHESQRQRVALLDEIGRLRISLSEARRDLRLASLESAVRCQQEPISPKRETNLSSKPEPIKVSKSCHHQERAIFEIKDAQPDIEATTETNSQSYHLLYESVRVQNAKLLIEITELRQALNRREISLKMSDRVITELRRRIDDLTSDLAESKAVAREAMEERTTFRISLDKALRENDEIEESVSSVRREFEKFGEIYAYLRLKNRELEELRSAQELAIASRQHEIEELRNENLVFRAGIEYGNATLSKLESDLNQLDRASRQPLHVEIRYSCSCGVVDDMTTPRNILFLPSPTTVDKERRFVVENRRLKILCRANELRSAEAVRRYEIYYHTLLRKVVEYRKLITNARNRHDQELLEARLEYESVDAERRFLRRLCQDLKFSLTVTTASRGRALLERKLHEESAKVARHEKTLDFVRGASVPQLFNLPMIEDLLRREGGSYLT